MWAPNIAKNRVSDEWMHISDILPTLAAAANVPLSYFKDRLDGVNHWPSLTGGTPGPRNLIVHNIDEIDSFQAIMEDGWKLVDGTTLNGTYDGFLGNFIEPEARMNSTYYYNLVSESKTNQLLRPYNLPLDPATVDRLQKQATVICQRAIPEARPCNPLVAPCLFNLNVDPCENNNLAATYPERVDTLLGILSRYAETSVAPRNKGVDPMSDPRHYNNTWTYWWDERKADTGIRSNTLVIVLLVTVGVISAILIVHGITLISNTRRSTKRP